MITGKNFEERKQQALKYKQRVRESQIKLSNFHKNLSKNIGDHYATKLLSSDVNATTNIAGIFKRNLFINTLPYSFSIDLFYNKFHGEKKESKTSDSEVIIDDSIKIEVLKSNRDLEEALQTMEEEGSTGDVLEQLNDQILRFGAMFLIFHDKEECAKIFMKYKDELTSDIKVETDNGTKRITKEEDEMNLSIGIITDDCKCTDEDECTHQIWV